MLAFRTSHSSPVPLLPQKSQPAAALCPGLFVLTRSHCSPCARNFGQHLQPRGTAESAPIREGTRCCLPMGLGMGCSGRNTRTSPAPALCPWDSALGQRELCPPEAGGAGFNPTPTQTSSVGFVWLTRAGMNRSGCSQAEQTPHTHNSSSFLWVC